MFEREKTENHPFLSVAVLAKLQELFSSLADKGTRGCFLSKNVGQGKKKKKKMWGMPGIQSGKYSSVSD